jgi:hypothetical protein
MAEIGALQLAAFGGSALAGLAGGGEATFRARRAQQAIEESIARATQLITEREAQAVGGLETARERGLREFQPFAQAGAQALEVQKAALGLPSAAQFRPETSALFRFQERLLTEAINRNLASKGLAGSPVGLRAFEEPRQRLIAEEGERQISRLANMVNLGFAGAGQRVGLIGGTAGQIAQTRLGTGQALAGLAGQAGAAGAQTEATLAAIRNQQLANITGGLTGLAQYQALAQGVQQARQPQVQTTLPQAVQTGFLPPPVTIPLLPPSRRQPF